MNNNRLRVPVSKLRNSLDPRTLGFKTTAEVPPLEGMVGQDRALRAMEFGFQVDTEAYNVYVAGPMGTGKMTAIKDFLRRLAPTRPTPLDWCYVYNFEAPDHPRAIGLPAGKGQEFARDMDRLVESAKEEIPRVFKSEDYERRKSQVLKDIETRRTQISERVEQDARQQGFTIQPTPIGIATVPIVDGHPMTAEEFEALPEAVRKQLQAAGEKLKAELEQALREARDLESQARERVEQLDREMTLLAIGPLLNALRVKYRDVPEVVSYLNQVQNDIPDHLSDFRMAKAEGAPSALEALLREDHLTRYKVNVLVDNRQTKGAPVVIEYRPTYYNLLGRVDYRSRLGAAVTDFTMIKPGAIHRANGGYLVVEAKDLLLSPFAWESLKRTLRSGEVRIENLGEQYTAVPTATLRPEPIPINLKVVLVGPSFIYYLLHFYDEDFRRLFAVRADFDVEMDRTDAHIMDYARFISALVKKNGLRDFDRTAVARVIDLASRDVSHQERLSTRFLDIAKLVAEADYWAKRNGNRYVTAKDVDQAIEEREFRSNLLEAKLRREILEGTLHVATEGVGVGQANGLSIVDLGDRPFGRPTRVTARTFLGTRGVVNIEREVKLSGPIHTKGFLILSTYLSAKYAQDKPLALSGSITFEQTYDEVEGDSASSTELYCLLSSLSNLPLKQSIAITGSVNQLGEVQAIGGVNQKIEGFFKLAKERGLNGEQGVMIPADNVKNLMLRDEVVEAVKAGKFHLWAVKNVDEGLEILTGKPAGEMRPDGTYPEGTVHYLVNRRLEQYAQRMKEFGRPTPEGRPTPFRQVGEEREVAEPE